MLKKIVLVLVLAIAGVLIYAATKPDTFEVQRKATIAAPPDKVFALIDDFHHWSEWSPWEKLDPAMTRTFSGNASGTGAVYAWKGNEKVGQGRMEIIESSPPGKLTIKLDFVEPFPSSNVAEFVLTPKDGGTEVAWSMHGPNPYVSKVMDVFASMDEMVGKDFETGLANMKAVAEH